MSSEQFVVLKLAAEEYAIPITQVKEIIPYNGVTKLPKMPEFMEGIINLRGKVISIIDLARKFAMQTGKNSDRQVLNVEVEDFEIGLLVDSVTEVIDLDEKDVESANGVMQSIEVIKSIGKVNNRLLIMLDLNKLFTDEELIVIKEAE